MPSGDPDSAGGRPPPEHGLPPSGHLLLTYRGDAPPWRSVVSFLMAGIADDRRLVYLHDRSDPEELEDQLRGADLDVAQLVTSGQLHFLAAEDYHPEDGELEPGHLVQSLRSGLVDAVRAGFDGLQVVGEAGWISDRASPETLVEFERRADEVLGAELVDILCMYPAAEWADPVLDALREVHGKHFHHPGSGGGGLERVE